MAAQGTTTVGRIRRRAGFRVNTIRLAVVAAALLTIALGVGFAFAGSSDRIATGTKIAGVDVGGLTAPQARALLARKARSVATVPVTFVAGGHSWRIRPAELGISADWGAAVATALDRGGGFGFVRGYRRLALRFSPLSIQPKPTVYDAAVDYEVGKLGNAVDRSARNARLSRHGLEIDLRPGRAGAVLDRKAARGTLVRALAGFGRGRVELPVRVKPPKVAAQDLRAALQLDRRVVAAPVTLTLDEHRWQLSRRQLASMLLLQHGRGSDLELGGPAANAYFAGLGHQVAHAPRNAGFAVDGSDVRIIPARTGLGLDVPRTAERVLKAARRSVARTAELVISTVQPKRSTADAKTMGITGIVGAYETEYGGVPNRIHNVQLVAHLVDEKLIAPGATFSFNEATGERTAAKGFLEAPVIINGELQTGLGGGVCQVSTTVFNAAYEAGLPITARTNHALYISHYPLGRDATVNYPDTDLKFANDTDHWLLLRTFVGSSSLVVRLYGTPQDRRVVSDTAPLVAHGKPPIKRTVDRSLKPGQRVVDDFGVPAQTTSVRRRVYAPGGKLLYDTTWYSSYKAEPRLVRIGPPKPKAKPPVDNALTVTEETKLPQ